MYASWTVLQGVRGRSEPPWTPSAATWWQAGHSSPGRARAPEEDGRWWSILATWDDRVAAFAGPPAVAGVNVWHVVLEPLTQQGDIVLTNGERPFEGLCGAHAYDGPVALITIAAGSDDQGRAREFYRRFLHVTRDVATAPGHLASLVQAPAVESEAGPVLTFSAWQDMRSGVDWAYSASRPHTSAVARQRSHGLVQHSGSIRCAILSSYGSLGEAGDPLAPCWRTSTATDCG